MNEARRLVERDVKEVPKSEGDLGLQPVVEVGRDGLEFCVGVPVAEAEAEGEAVLVETATVGVASADEQALRSSSLLAVLMAGGGEADD